MALLGHLLTEQATRFSGKRWQQGMDARALEPVCLCFVWATSAQQASDSILYMYQKLGIHGIIRHLTVVHVLPALIADLPVAVRGFTS